MPTSASLRTSDLPEPQVVVYAVPGRQFECEYEIESCRVMAQRLAALKGLDYAGDLEPGREPDGPLYVVPTDTLIGGDTAHALGVRSEQDLFGGVAPASFVATKAITQPLVSLRARAPEGWSHAFRDRTHLAVLRGFTAFSRDDAREAARRLFAYGPLRIKPVHARGGLGQVVVDTASELAAALAAVDETSLAVDGIVLEENLTQVTTCSIGLIRVGGIVASYYGTQRLTRNNFGQEVYGGTRMKVVRGDFEALLRHEHEASARMAIGQARAYDEAALALYPGVILSRSNYDVAQGIDSRGNWCSGVLEQSWRIGGASPAEIVALEAFADDPALRVVHSECLEYFGDGEAPPPGARPLLDMLDPVAGRIRKYTLCEAAGHA